jgi:hypothetical protein
MAPQSFSAIMRATSSRLVSDTQQTGFSVMISRISIPDLLADRVIPDRDGPNGNRLDPGKTGLRHETMFLEGGRGEIRGQREKKRGVARP